jgi:hypothetical protein
MTQADRIRQFALDRYLVPARTRNERRSFPVRYSRTATVHLRKKVTRTGCISSGSGKFKALLRKYSEPGEALKAAWSGEPIDYVGVAGAFEFAANGDPTISRFDIFEYKGGKLDVIKQIDASK